MAKLHSYENIIKNWARCQKVPPKSISRSKVTSKSQGHGQKARLLLGHFGECRSANKQAMFD
jgi:hypothetical protein